MKKKYLLVPSLVFMVVLLGASSASAYGGPGMMKNIDPIASGARWDNQITTEANILGITVDEMKNYWAQGKSLKAIAKEKGISDADLQTKMQALRVEEQKQWLQSLVSQGKITQAQADSRLQFMQVKKVGNIGKHGRGLRGAAK